MITIDNVKNRLTDIEIMPSDELLESLIQSTRWIILNKRYPFGTIPNTYVPERYEDLQLRMVIELVRKLGNEGMLSRDDTGVSTQWASSNVSEDLLSEIVPMAGYIQ